MRDILKVSRVLDDDSVYIPVNGHACTDEGAVAYSLLVHEGVYVLMPNEGSVFAFVPYDKNIFQVHIAVLPEFRGKVAVLALKSAFAWIFDNSTCIKIIGFEAEKNKAAIRFIGCLGVEREGVLKKADGEGGDVIIFGYAKP